MNGSPAASIVNPPPISKRVYFTRLLLESDGWLKTAYERASISRQLANKYVREMEEKGVIKMVQKWPVKFKFLDQCKPPYGGSPNPFTIKKKLFIPKAIGGLFDMIGRPNFHYSKGLATVRQPGFVAQFGKRKAQIWVFSEAIEGQTPQELKDSGKRHLDALASLFEKEQNLRLNLLRYYDGIEWVLNDKPASKETATQLGLESKGGYVDIDGKRIKFDDWSDPKLLQINPLPNAPPDGATEFVKTLWIITYNQASIKYLAENGPQQMAEMTKYLQEANKTFNLIKQEIEELKKRRD